MAAETTAAELLTEVCRSEERFGHGLFREHRLSWYAERVDAARHLLEAQYTEEHTVRSVARSVGMSTFHFARVFSELAGTPPHRYLSNIRLREGARSLEQGASVTEACFANGFHNLSHFVRLFRRRFGISPSRYVNQRSS